MTKKRSLPIQVRSSSGNGKRLFDWNPDDRTLLLVQRGILYRVKLTSEGCQMLEERPSRQTI